MLTYYTVLHDNTHSTHHFLSFPFDHCEIRCHFSFELKGCRIVMQNVPQQNSESHCKLNIASTILMVNSWMFAGKCEHAILLFVS